MYTPEVMVVAFRELFDRYVSVSALQRVRRYGGDLRSRGQKRDSLRTRYPCVTRKLRLDPFARIGRYGRGSRVQTRRADCSNGGVSAHDVGNQPYHCGASRCTRNRGRILLSSPGPHRHVSGRRYRDRLRLKQAACHRERKQKKRHRRLQHFDTIQQSLLWPVNLDSRKPRASPYQIQSSLSSTDITILLWRKIVLIFLRSC